MLAYFQQYFVTVLESHEYGKVQIMQSLNEPQVKTQMLDIFSILVLSRGERIFASFQRHRKSQKSEKCCGGKSKASTNILISFYPIPK